MIKYLIPVGDFQQRKKYGRALYVNNHSRKQVCLTIKPNGLFLSPIWAHSVASTIFWRDKQKTAGLGREILYNIQSLYIFRPSSSLFLTTCATVATLSECTRAGDRHTMSARSPPVGGIPSRAIWLPGIMFATLGVSPAGPLGPNPHHPFPKVTNIPTNQMSTPLFMENLVCCLLSICS